MMKTLIIFFAVAVAVAVGLIGCKEVNLTHQKSTDFVAESAHPCSANPGKCKTGEISGEVVKELREAARKAGLDNDPLFYVAIDKDGKSASLRPDTDYLSSDKEGEYLITNEEFQPDVPIQARGKPKKYVAIPFFGSECVRWVHHVTIDGLYYIDYCKRYR